MRAAATPVGPPDARWGLELVHADAWLLAVHKPSGLLSQPGLGPALRDSALSRLQQRWPTARLAHRLDRDTSGLLLLALDAASHRHLSLQFQRGLVRKAYVAEVHGQLARRRGCIDAPLARVSTRPPRYGVVPGGKPSLTLWRRLALGPASTRLLLLPRTGRSHQLRAHLAAIGHPILGDPLYGPADAAADPGSGRLRLHALGLRFHHPHSGAPLRLRCAGHWGDP
ncbi:RluA family pseudouridine synthase [Cyanobium sp. PCC 7001]|uniref:RluA family pseudouridine synthase n=1 Tax=Cyanobium sp. PCC 7001 TaxID=180281 RepID=UPI001CEDB5B8|nr:RluA family pseudouridine synthase [Cyanobium sp. PCC 7001]